MKSKWLWYVLAATWLLSAVMRIMENRSVLAIVMHIIGMLVFLGGGIVLTICEKRDDGQQLWNKMQKWILIAVIALTVGILAISYL